MDSPQVFIAFGAIMLVVALLGVAIDWFGKPLRHRKFVPKMYRFPDERQPRRSKVKATEWSDASMVLPVVEAPSPERLMRYPAPPFLAAGNGHGPAIPLELNGAVLDPGPPTAQVPVVPLDVPTPGLVTVEETDPAAALAPELTDDLREPALDDEPTDDLREPALDDDELADASAAGDGPGSRVDRKCGWSLGGYVFNLTADGTEPSAATVRTRYWKNVAGTAGASIFGVGNLDRMARGKPPQRRNHRTGKLESMRLPAVSFTDNDGQTPVPAWPDDEIDPFSPVDPFSPADDAATDRPTADA